MRRLTATLLTLASTAAAVGATLVAPSAAVAADTWRTHDKNCRTVIDIDAQPVGSVCAEVQKRVTATGAVNGYRARTTVNPTEGNWLKPSTYVWSTSGGVVEVCGGGCPQQTTAWSSPWSSVKTVPGSYTVRGESSGGGFDVAASWSNWFQLAEKCATYAGAGEVCVRRHERSHRGVYQERGQIAAPRQEQVDRAAHGPGRRRQRRDDHLQEPRPVRPVVHPAQRQLVGHRPPEPGRPRR